MLKLPWLCQVDIIVNDYWVWDIKSKNYNRYTFGLMVKFGPSVWSYGFFNSLLRFLIISSSGFGPMYPPPNELI